MPKFGSGVSVLDRFDLHLLNLVQDNDSRTADSLANDVPLSPSAIARRLRQLRGDGWISRTIAILSPKLTQRRLRALVLIQMADHGNHQAKAQLEKQLAAAPQVQFSYEIAGPHDFVAFLDCADMAEFNNVANELLASSDAVRRYETHFVKREVKFAPFVELSEAV